MIVARILGERYARPATKLIGCLESLLGVWAFAGIARVECAAVQTLAIGAMNSLESCKRVKMRSPARKKS